MNTLLLVNWGHVWMVTGLGFLLVFVLLVVLIFILKGFGAIMQKAIAAPAPKAAQVKQQPLPQKKEDNEMAINSNVTAAIAMALHLSYFGGEHDEEPTRITIIPHHTTWNDKMYGMNNLIR